jgi:hypothetical protein
MTDRPMPSTTAVSASNAAAEKKANKPEKPDEEAFKANLAKAENELAAVMQRLVCHFLIEKLSYIEHGVLFRACLYAPSKFARTAERSFITLFSFTSVSLCFANSDNSYVTE